MIVQNKSKMNVVFKFIEFQYLPLSHPLEMSYGSNHISRSSTDTQSYEHQDLSFEHSLHNFGWCKRQL